MWNTDLPRIPLIAILKSTDNFSEASKLGEGGFGPVYKVVMIWSFKHWFLTFNNFYLLQTFIRELFLMEHELQSKDSLNFLVKAQRSSIMK